MEGEVIQGKVQGSRKGSNFAVSCHLTTLFEGGSRGEDVPAGRREKVPAAKERRDERGRAQQGQVRI